LASTPPLISLDDDACLDPALVGVKAANLAKARRRGLPVLPGVVVPIEAGRTPIELGLKMLRDAGPGKARLAVDRADLPVDLTAVLAAAGAALGENLILRSSTTLDDDARFSGAFASIADVRPSEVASAVRGCWSSLFSASTLARLEGAGVRPDGFGVAVLIQRMLDPELGGTAELQHDGSLSVAAVRGRPGPLLAGAVNGIRGTLAETGALPRELADLGLSRAGSAALRASVHGARLAGSRCVEWAIEAGKVWVLQLDRGQDRVASTAASARDGGESVDLIRATPASPGRVVGRVAFVRSADDRPSELDGRILVVDRALPDYAPLLYRAAGLIAIEGSAGAHLCTVAKSLHVPAVVGLTQLGNPDGTAAATALSRLGSWILVDGDQGTVQPWSEPVSQPVYRPGRSDRGRGR
jgi:phosphoenolpyruvate synthase/pyruvate phosphate dikinase